MLLPYQEAWAAVASVPPGEYERALLGRGPPDLAGYLYASIVRATAPGLRVRAPLTMQYHGKHDLVNPDDTDPAVLRRYLENLDPGAFLKECPSAASVTEALTTPVTARLPLAKDHICMWLHAALPRYAVYCMRHRPDYGPAASSLVFHAFPTPLLLLLDGCMERLSRGLPTTIVPGRVWSPEALCHEIGAMGLTVPSGRYLQEGFIRTAARMAQWYDETRQWWPLDDFAPFFVDTRPLPAPPSSAGPTLRELLLGDDDDEEEEGEIIVQRKRPRRDMAYEIVGVDNGSRRSKCTEARVESDDGARARLTVTQLPTNDCMDHQTTTFAMRFHPAAAARDRVAAGVLRSLSGQHPRAYMAARVAPDQSPFAQMDRLDGVFTPGGHEAPGRGEMVLFYAKETTMLRGRGAFDERRVFRVPDMVLSGATAEQEMHAARVLAANSGYVDEPLAFYKLGDNLTLCSLALWAYYVRLCVKSRPRATVSERAVMVLVPNVVTDEELSLIHYTCSAVLGPSVDVHLIKEGVAEIVAHTFLHPPPPGPGMTWLLLAGGMTSDNSLSETDGAGGVRVRLQATLGLRDGSSRVLNERIAALVTQAMDPDDLQAHFRSMGPGAERRFREQLVGVIDLSFKRNLESRYRREIEDGAIDDAETYAFTTAVCGFKTCAAVSVKRYIQIIEDGVRESFYNALRVLRRFWGLCPDDTKKITSVCVAGGIYNGAGDLILGRLLREAIDKDPALAARFALKAAEPIKLVPGAGALGATLIGAERLLRARNLALASIRYEDHLCMTHAPAPETLPRLRESPRWKLRVRIRRSAGPMTWVDVPVDQGEGEPVRVPIEGGTPTLLVCIAMRMGLPCLPLESSGVNDTAYYTLLDSAAGTETVAAVHDCLATVMAASSNGYVTVSARVDEVRQVMVVRMAEADVEERLPLYALGSWPGAAWQWLLAQRAARLHTPRLAGLYGAFMRLFESDLPNEDLDGLSPRLLRAHEDLLACMMDENDSVRDVARAWRAKAPKAVPFCIDGGSVFSLNGVSDKYEDMLAGL